MKENAKCFVKISQGIYEEITYKELEERRQSIPSYKNKKFIYVNKMLFEVSDKEYRDYYSEIERNRYSKKVLQKLNTVSIEQLNFDEDMDDKQVIIDDTINVENEIERKNEIEELKKALLKLDNDEYKMIRELFFKEKTVREYAKVLGLPYATVQYKKKLVLKKLKKLMKF